MTGSLTIQQVSRHSGFSEPTLRYYEKIGLLGTVGRDSVSGHRRYGEATVARVETLACLRSSGMTVEGMRRYVELLEAGDDSADELYTLFADQAERLAGEIDRLRVRQEYLALKARMWRARADGDSATEKEVVARVTEILQGFRA
ncbi:MerR family transcriptional regulator [Herbidospora yilanensis]|uniref:MerR family transcriptional regulator n=1 Tax=Herbidospora yilanensis TaxID=354426 RepID=UPI000784CEF9|nr:MerR family transcriptional regulator [Herbidospora yilanensis]